MGRLYVIVRVRVTIIWNIISLLLPNISKIPTLDLIAENFGQNALCHEYRK